MFNVQNAFTFFKAGQFVASGWKHKDIVNPGDYEFIMVISGEIYIEIEGRQYTVKKHDCLLIPPYTRHFGFKESKQGSTHYWMHFYPSGSVDFTSDYLAGSSCEKREEYYKLYIPQHFRLPEFEKLVILCKQLLDCASDREISPLTANFLITSIAIEVSNQYRKLQLHECQKLPTKFEMIINWIRIHSHEPLTVHQVAEKFDITPVYLTRMFKKYKNTTTNNFINEIKIRQAEEMLLTSGKSIKEIALNLSFNNEKYFMRVFKKFHGITPTEFRNSYPKTYLNNIAVDPSIPKPEIMMSPDQL